MTGSDADVRWVQGLSNYTLALGRLTEAVELAGRWPLSSLEQQGNSGITGSRDATREAFTNGLVDDGEAWMAIIRSGNQSSHTYNQQVANTIADAIVGSYHPLLLALQTSMQQRVPT